MEFAELAPEKNEPDGHSSVPLQSVFLHVTKACNLSCKYCYFSARTPMPDEMTTEDFDNLWPLLVKAQPKKVIFTGGEPLLRPDIVEMLEGLRDADPSHDVIRCLNSNGLLVTPALARRLAGLADEVRISLDGFERQNDALRGNGNFAAATKALYVYREAGLNPKILITVTRQTLPDLEEFLMFLVGRGFTSINVNWFRPIGRGKGHNDWCVRGADIKFAIRRAFSRLGAHPTSPGGTVETDSQYHCGVGRFLNIMPNGDVFPCHVLTNPEFRCGNVKTQNLLDICRQNGLLGQLGNLDFRVLANEEPAVAELTKADTCFGTVYAEKHRLNVWRNHLAFVTRY